MGKVPRTEVAGRGALARLGTHGCVGVSGAGGREGGQWLGTGLWNAICSCGWLMLASKPGETTEGSSDRIKAEIPKQLLHVAPGIIQSDTYYVFAFVCYIDSLPSDLTTFSECQVVFRPGLLQ